MTRIARVYQHAATNENSLDLIRSSTFVGAEREENLVRNDPDQSEFTNTKLVLFPKTSKTPKVQLIDVSARVLGFSSGNDCCNQPVNSSSEEGSSIRPDVTLTFLSGSVEMRENCGK